VSTKALIFLFRPLKNNSTGTLDKHLDPRSIHRNIATKYGRETGIDAEVIGLCVHSLQATAANNALSNEADIAKVQEWLGHANVSTTRLYDQRKSKPEGSRPFMRSIEATRLIFTTSNKSQDV
jgi:integrase/recombinase XerD